MEAKEFQDGPTAEARQAQHGLRPKAKREPRMRTMKRSGVTEATSSNVMQYTLRHHPLQRVVEASVRVQSGTSMLSQWSLAWPMRAAADRGKKSKT